MIKIAICDDDVILTSKMEDILLRISKNRVIELNIDIFYDGLSLKKNILNNNRYDLIYLDIEINTLNGIDAGKFVRSIDQNVLVIYISSYENYLKELFEIEPFRFIDKPIDWELTI